MSDQELPDQAARVSAYDQNRRSQPAVPKTEAMANARRMAAMKAIQSEASSDAQQAASAPAPAQQPAAQTPAAAPSQAAASQPAPASNAPTTSSGDTPDNQKLILIGVAVLVAIILLVVLMG